MSQTCQADVPAVPTPPVRTKAEWDAMFAGVNNLAKGVVHQAGYRRQKAEDVVQDCLLELWRVRERFDPARGAKWTTFATALFWNVVRRLKTDFAQSVEGVMNQDGDFTLAPGPTPEPLDELIAADDAAGADEIDDAAGDLHRLVRLKLASGLLDKLDPKCVDKAGANVGIRRLVEMVVIDGLSPAQIAEQLGQPVKSVKTNLQKAIAKLTGEPFPKELTATRGQKSRARKGRKPGPVSAGMNVVPPGSVPDVTLAVPAELAPVGVPAFLPGVPMAAA